MTITTYTDREIALRQQLAAMTVTATEYQQAADKMAMAHKVERDALTQRVKELESMEKQNSDTIIWQADEISNHLNTIESSRMMQEPVLYQRRMKPAYGQQWTTWEDCSEETFKHYLTVPKLHGWAHESRALYAAPVVAPDVLKEIERKNEALLNIARKAESLKKECGDDPESPQAIRNGRYMHLSYLARAAMGGAND